MRVGIDIHGVLDHHPEKFIGFANMILGQKGFINDHPLSEDYQVFILTGPPKQKALQELHLLAKDHNDEFPFWDEVHSIVDYVVENDIPHYYDDDGYIWTEKEEDWNEVKGILAHKLKLDLHFDDSECYRKYFPAGVFCHVERKR